VNVRRYKAAAFVLSSMYAGLAGVLVALAFQRPVPDYFDLGLSVTYLAMIVIGGLGSVRGAVLGAAFVTALPLVLTQYSDKIEFLAQPGQSGVGAAEFSKYVYGAAIVLVILVAPGGLSTLATGSTGRPGRIRRAPQQPVSGSPRPSGDSTSDKPYEEAKQV
jgi:branched-chain amino acid transport system permease protein